jgi:hypothetical protein
MNKKKDILDVQNVRLLDIFVVTPFLIYTSTLRTNPDWVRFSLLVLGVSTFVYNGVNYLKEKENV